MNQSIKASAPGRANLIGEHIDYAGGVVLPFAISQRTSVQISQRNDNQIILTSKQSQSGVATSISELAEFTGPTWARYPLGVIDVIVKSGFTFPGLDIEIDGKVAQGAGLSSSAALECATATALNELFALNISPLDLAKIAQKAENEYVGMPCGLMDQAASILSKKNMLLHFDCLSLEATHLPFDLESEGLSILLIDSQVKHELVDGGYANRFKACESARTTLGLDSLRHLTREKFERADLPEDIYKRVSHVVGEMERVEKAVTALNAGDFYKVGALMNQTHESLRDLYEVSCIELDLATEIAGEVGALGARMMGGGFGGSAIILTPKDLEVKIVNEVEKAFAEKGFKAPRAFSASPSAGATVI
jgi:galactokinase